MAHDPGCKYTMQCVSGPKAAKLGPSFSHRIIFAAYELSDQAVRLL